MDLREHIPGAILGTLGTLLVTGLAYVFVIKDNTRELSYLSDRLEKLEREQREQLLGLEGALDDSRKRIGKLNLFIVSVHPDKYSPDVSSIEKFRELSAEDLESFAENVSDTLPIYEQARTYLKSVDEERLDSLLNEFDNAQQWGGQGGAQRVAEEIGIDSAQLQSLQMNKKLQQYLREEGLNGNDLNFALEVMSAEQDSNESDELKGKRDRVVERLLMDSLSPESKK